MEWRHYELCSSCLVTKRSELSHRVRDRDASGLALKSEVRRSKADARAYVVRLTEKGEETLRSTRRAANETDELLLAPLSPSRRAQFLEDLRRVAEGGQDD